MFSAYVKLHHVLCCNTAVHICFTWLHPVLQVIEALTTSFIWQVEQISDHMHTCQIGRWCLFQRFFARVKVHRVPCGDTPVDVYLTLSHPIYSHDVISET